MNYGFHPEAYKEYQASAICYLREAGERTSRAFVFDIEAGIEVILQSPDRWPLVNASGIRRYVCGRFPFVIYYRCEEFGVAIYAVMHCRHRPGYW